MEQKSEVKLARTLGLGSIILLGVGALLGGGIFTLTGLPYLVRLPDYPGRAYLLPCF